MEVPPNQTLYINNLNEKVKKEGEVVQCDYQLSSLKNVFSTLSCRAEEVSLRHFLAVRSHSGHRCRKVAQNERTGVCGVPGE